MKDKDMLWLYSCFDQGVGLDGLLDPFRLHFSMIPWKMNEIVEIFHSCLVTYKQCVEGKLCRAVDADWEIMGAVLEKWIFTIPDYIHFTVLTAMAVGIKLNDSCGSTPLIVWKSVILWSSKMDQLIDQFCFIFHRIWRCCWLFKYILHWVKTELAKTRCVEEL